MYFEPPVNSPTKIIFFKSVLVFLVFPNDVCNWVDILLITNCFFQTHHFPLFSCLLNLPQPEACFGNKANLFIQLKGTKKSTHLLITEPWTPNPKCKLCCTSLGKGVTTAMPAHSSLFSSIL